MTTSGGDAELQAHLTRLLLDAVAEDGFALAGAGALRAHGLTERPTHDIDLFAKPLITPQAFRSAVDQACLTLGDAGFDVVWQRRTDTFARLRLQNSSRQLLDVDLAVNWRADPPVKMGIGPVVSERDAVAGKISAIYSRGEIRDFLDLDAIRASGRYSDDDLLALGREHDMGFDREMFAAQLSRVLHFAAEEAEEYGIGADGVVAVQQRTLAWALRLRDAQQSGQ